MSFIAQSQAVKLIFETGYVSLSAKYIYTVFTFTGVLFLIYHPKMDIVTSPSGLPVGLMEYALKLNVWPPSVFVKASSVENRELDPCGPP